MIPAGAPVSSLPGVGKKTAAALKKLGVATTGDLLGVFPKRWTKREPPAAPSEVVPGETVAVLGAPRGFRVGAGGATSATISDGRGSVTLRWFRNPWITRLISEGKWYVFVGKATEFGGRIVVAQPAFTPWEEYAPTIGALRPTYPLRAGLTNEAMTKFVLEAIAGMEEPPETLPADVVARRALVSPGDAIRCLHWPADEASLEAAKRRIKYEEFHDLLFAVRYRHFARGLNEFRFGAGGEEAARALVGSFGFELTGSQKEAIAAIESDLSGRLVSNRMVQGDVGCGKTAVAAVTMAYVAGAGYQAALMAPTETLAAQHHEEISAAFERAGLAEKFPVVALFGSMKEKEKKVVREKLASGAAAVAIGTHALIQPKTKFARLAYAIVDEQHRFGVEQREELAKKAGRPIHQVTMTATPIPRTTGTAIFGGLDVTVMRDKPAARLPIKSCAVTDAKRSAAYALAKREIAAGRQVYAICPMVADDYEGKASVEGYARRLEAEFPGVAVAKLHGKMSAAEKEEAMKTFADGGASILVATTVVEVGVNVPNATVILIEDADQFGALQLHQLRGRVGRGRRQSYCVFLTSQETVCEKLAVVAGTNDGFEIAEADYRMRKAGTLTGTRQSGDMGFKLADPAEDEALLLAADEDVRREIPSV